MRLPIPMTLLLAGCTGLAGLSDLTFEGAGAGGMQNAGGGGSGQGSTTGMSVSVSSVSSSSSGMMGIPAEDWSGSLVGVYSFESETLGVGSNGPPLEQIGAIQTTAGQVGDRAVELQSGVGFQTSAIDYEIGDQTNLTVAAWVRSGLDGDTPAEIVTRYNGGVGFSFDVVGDTLECFMGRGSGNGYASAKTAGLSVPNGVWTHVACVFDQTDELIVAYVDGEPTQSQPSNGADLTALGTIAVSSSTYPLTGELDELVIHPERLSEAALFRIYACNVDGSLCQCDLQDPQAYLSCGRVDECPPIMPPCNATGP